MPPRWLSILIVAFWLCTAGWLFYQDVWLSLLPGQPPPYTINLEDEVEIQQARIQWIVFYNDHAFLRAETWVKFNKEDDTFSLNARVWQPTIPLDPSPGADPFGGLITIKNMNSAYRVTRQGDLRAVFMDFAGAAHIGPLLSVRGDGALSGEVRGGASSRICTPPRPCSAAKPSRRT